MKLNELCEIRIGLLLSRRKTNEINDTIKHYRAFTLSSFNEYGKVDSDKLESFDAEHIEDKYIAEEGDVVVRLPEPNYAICIDNTTKGIVLSSMFLCLKVDRQKILPEFLVWLFNSGAIRKQLDLIKVGSSIRTINTGQLSLLTINIIPIDKQRLLIEYNKLATREAILYEQISEKKKMLNYTILQQLYKGEKNDN